MLKGHVFNEQLFASEIFAVFVNSFLDGKDGVINGFGNGMAVTASGYNLTVQSGVCCIQGRFLQEDTSSTITAGATQTYARLVLEIDLDETNTESTFLQGSYKIITNSSEYPTPTQTDIVNNVSGIYQFPLARFQVGANGITGLADERTFLDFLSIYGEISEHISAIDDEKIFLPIGGGCDYYGAELPNENYMWADGSAISRTTYSGLFAVIGTAYGEGDGSTTFNLPDLRRRHPLMKGDDNTLGTRGGNDEIFALANPTGGGINYKNAAKAFQTNYRTTGTGSKEMSTQNNSNAGIMIAGSDDGTTSRESFLICNYIIRVK